MAKNSIRDYSATNSSNTDIQSIDISEGCSPAGINNAIREVMADLKDVSTGAVALESPAADSLTVTGDLTVDTNTLYVNSTNNRVGIGTSSPNRQLTVSNSGAALFSLVSTGNDNCQVLFGDSASDTVGKVVYSHTSNYMSFETNASEAMRIDSSGNVGIGTTTHYDSSTKLTVAGRIHTSNGTAIGSMNYGGGAVINVGSISNHPLQFITNNTTRATIDTSGNVLVGTASSIGGVLQVYNNSSAGRIINTRSYNTSNQYHHSFENNSGTLVGSILVSTTSTSYNTSSDYRLKENVTADWDATTRLKQLNPVRFNFIADADTTVDGFLAHEVQDIVPEAISGTKDAMMDEEYEVTPAVLDEDGNEVTPAVMGTRSVPNYQGIDQSKLVPLLVKTIQELEARITALEAN